MLPLTRAAALALALGLCACGPVAPEPAAVDAGVLDAGPDAVPDATDASGTSRFIVRVVSFTPGAGAGFGKSRMPDVVYGPPVGGGACRGSTDVVALGTGGEIVVEMGTEITDGPGPDLLVFENPFYIGCDPSKAVYAELGEIGVSDDAVTWVTFPCTATSPPYGSCAGWHPVYATPDNGISPLDPARAGGDPLDLADVGVARARFVRVRDTASGVDADGFDLDAMAVVNTESP